MYFLWKFKDAAENFNGDFVHVTNEDDYKELMATGEYQDATGVDSQYLNEIENGSHGYKSKPAPAPKPKPKKPKPGKGKYKTKDMVPDK